MASLSPELLDFDAESLDTRNLQNVYKQNGIVIVRNAICSNFLSDICTMLLTFVSHRLKSLGIKLPFNEDLDSYFNKLSRIQQQYAMDIIRATKDSPFFYQAISHPDLLRFLNILLNLDSNLLQCVYDTALLRIDPPCFDQRNFEWHQDYPYNMTSRNAVTSWIPLTRVNQTMGSMAFIPGSHKDIIPVISSDYKHIPGKGSGRNIFKLDAKKEELDERCVELPDLSPGDIVFFHCLLLHRSGLNRSDRSRWVLNLRHGDALDDDVVERGWTAVRTSSMNLFHQMHPNLVKVVKTSS